MLKVNKFGKSRLFKFNLDEAQIDNIQILKQNLVKYIEVTKISKEENLAEP